MKSLVILAVLVAACQASTFKYAPPGKCSYPTWTCSCKVLYNCDGTGEVPDSGDVEDDSIPDVGCVKDLAPSKYELRIPGKRWRREIWNSKEFCKDECFDRMNAFLCLNEDRKFSDYSGRAICSKLYYRVDPDDPTVSTSPFRKNGVSENCCGIFLQWGLGWCPQRWTKKIGTVGCLGETAVTEADVTGDFKLSFFSSTVSCDSGMPDSVLNQQNNFCTNPNCD